MTYWRKYDSSFLVVRFHKAGTGVDYRTWAGMMNVNVINIRGKVNLIWGGAPQLAEKFLAAHEVGKKVI